MASPCIGLVHIESVISKRVYNHWTLCIDKYTVNLNFSHVSSTLVLLSNWDTLITLSLGHYTTYGLCELCKTATNIFLYFFDKQAQAHYTYVN
jgi:hypothetical protein